MKCQSKTVRIGDGYCIDREELPQYKTLLKTQRAERQFFLKAQEKQWNVLKTGWPDYLIYKNGKLAFVEVKSNKNQVLRSNQIAMMKILASHSLICYTWNPESGFKRFREPVR